MHRIIELNTHSLEITFLASQDKILGEIISFFGNYELHLRTDYFNSLAKSIVGQQLSVKAAQTIWGRLEELCSTVSPEKILEQSEDLLRSIGVSRAKAQYLKNLSIAVSNGDTCLEDLDKLRDEEIINLLTSIKGIGNWTAEMFLIFSLGRLDVFSHGDVGLKRAMSWLYNKGETIDSNKIVKITDAWKPYRSVASLYLWEIINSGLLNKYRDFEEFLLMEEFK